MNTLSTSLAKPALNQAEPATAATLALGPKPAPPQLETSQSDQRENHRAKYHSQRPGIVAASIKLWWRQHGFPALCGVALLILCWQIIAHGNSAFPSPWATAQEAARLFAQPFYQNGPNDQGIGWNILASLKRVALGFGLAALIGIPLGFLIGRFVFLGRMFSPIISLLKPVSPLAWLPLGLLMFKAAHPAAIWAIFICSIWPMIINTAIGVQKVPQDYLNVARVLQLSEWKILSTILFPAVLPYLLTGVRLAIGTAWLVIVAAEMLTGGVGIGFWLWDEWNNLNVAHILIAIVVIGVVGLLLEYVLIMLAKAVTYSDSGV